MLVDRVKSVIRDVPDFPKKGILFKDITPVLADPDLFRDVLEEFTRRHKGKGVTKVAAIDARGFIFGGALADRLGAGFVPIRKKDKLPYRTFEQSYELEYGSNTIAVHRDAFRSSEKVLLVDDLLATGGTAAAAARLIEQAGGLVVEVDFLIELTFLNGRDRLSRYPLFALVTY